MMTENGSHQKDFDDEVSKTLKCLDDLPEVEAGPYFFARLQQKLDRSGEPKENWLGRLIFGYRLGPALLAAMILVNAGTVYVALTGDEARTEEREQYLEAIADEYSLSVSNPLSEVGNE